MNVIGLHGCKEDLTTAPWSTCTASLLQCGPSTGQGRKWGHSLRFQAAHHSFHLHCSSVLPLLSCDEGQKGSCFKTLFLRTLSSAHLLRAFSTWGLTPISGMMHMFGAICPRAKVVSLSFLDSIPMHFLHWLPAKAQCLQGNVRLVAMDTPSANKPSRTSLLPNTPTTPVLWVIRRFYPPTFQDLTSSHSFHVQNIGIQGGLQISVLSQRAWSAAAFGASEASASVPPKRSNCAEMMGVARVRLGACAIRSLWPDYNRFGSPTERPIPLSHSPGGPCAARDDALTVNVLLMVS